MNDANRTLRAAGRRARCAGISLVEACVSLAIFVILVGSVAYASRIALTVMTESTHETKLLFRVRRALDQAEEQLGRCSRVSVVALTENGWTLSGLENWFEQLGQQTADSVLQDGAAEVQSDLEKCFDAVSGATPDYPTATTRLGMAIANFEELVAGGYVDPTTAVTIHDALESVRTSLGVHSIAAVGGSGTGIANAWIEIEQAIADMDPLLPSEPLVSADQVLFRQIVVGADGPEYRPPPDQPPCSYYLRPTGNGEFELVFYDGSRSIVIANHLLDAHFDVQEDVLRITLTFAEERGGVTIDRTEIRSVVLRVP